MCVASLSPHINQPADPAQVLFVSGLTLIIGPKKTFYFFARKQKLRGSICFLGGIVLVFCKWPFIGVIVETFGFLNLFGCAYSFSCHGKPRREFSFSDFFPVVITFLRQLPFIGTLLSLPYIRGVSAPFLWDFPLIEFRPCHF